MVTAKTKGLDISPAISEPAARCDRRYTGWQAAVKRVRDGA
jgi:hypothetical protein